MAKEENFFLRVQHGKWWTYLPRLGSQSEHTIRAF